MRDAIDTFIRGAAAKNPDSPLQGGLVIFAAGNDGDVYGDAAVYPAAYGRSLPSVRWIGASGPLTIPITVRGSISRLPADAYTAQSVIDKKYYTNGMVMSTILCDDTMDYQDGRKDDDY